MRLFGKMLFRKMVRDIKSNISQFITIFLMVLIGVKIFIVIFPSLVVASASLNVYSAV